MKDRSAGDVPLMEPERGGGELGNHSLSNFCQFPTPFGKKLILNLMILRSNSLERRKVAWRYADH